MPAAPEQDALWKLAPLTATVGVVISSRGLHAIEGAWREIDKAFERVPELVPLQEPVRQRWPTLFPDGDVSLATAGMTADGGAALFFSPSGARLVFLPVVDRAKFLAYVNGERAEDGDHVGNLTCRMIDGRYACANPVQLLGRIGKGTVGDHVKLAGTRGDIELAIENLDEHVRAGIVARLERGEIVVHGAIRSPAMRGKVVNVSAQRFDTSKLAGFGVLNVGAFLMDLPAPRTPLAAGVTLGDLVRNMTGPILLSMPPGTGQGEIRVPMKDASIARTLVTHCEDIPYLAILSSTYSDDACHLTMPPLSVELDVRVDGSTLRATTKKVAGAPTTLHPTPIAKEMAAGDWAYALYGRGTALGITLPPGTKISLASMVGLRVLTWLSEAGAGVRGDGDVLRFYVGVRTVWSNPDDVVAKWLTLPFEQLFDPATLDAARTLAETAPTAPLADDLKAGTAVLAPIAALAMVAGYAAPSFIGPRELQALGFGRPRPASPEEALARMTAFKDAMCECDEAACAKRVSDEMNEWAMEQARRGYKAPDLPPTVQAKARVIGEQMGACLQAAYGAAGAREASEYIAKSMQFKNRLCACKDLECGEAVNRELTTWSEAFVKKLPAGSTMSAFDDRRVQMIQDQVRACMDALRAGRAAH